MGTHVTIATHCGSTVSLAHNRRDKSVSGKEEHINPDGEYEVWTEYDLADTYDYIFEDARQEFNSRQDRWSRRIRTDYLTAIRQDKRRKPVYEMLAGVYPVDGKIDHREQKQILHDYWDGWQQRNPRLIVIGAYYHDDEPGAQPHLHIDYIPIAHYERGMRVQVCYSRALEQMGYGHHDQGRSNPLVDWTAKENEILQGICEDHGLYVDHPQRGNKSRHKSTAEKKMEAQLAARQRALDARERELQDEAKRLQEEREILTGMLRQTQKQLLDMRSAFYRFEIIEKDYMRDSRKVEAKRQEHYHKMAKLVQQARSTADNITGNINKRSSSRDMER